MWSLAVNIWMAMPQPSSVVAGSGDRRAREVGYSRTAIYNHAQRVTQAVVHAQEGDVSSEALWAENARLHAENEALWEAWVTAEQLPERKQREFVATGSAMGFSLGQILLLLALVLPKGYPRVGRRPDAGSPRRAVKLGGCWQCWISAVSGWWRRCKRKASSSGSRRRWRYFGQTGG